MNESHVVNDPATHSIQSKPRQSRRIRAAKESTRKHHSTDLQGLAPSATRSNLREERLMSLWSFLASIPQCMSLDLARLTAAEMKVAMSELIPQGTTKPRAHNSVWSRSAIGRQTSTLTVISGDKLEPRGGICLHQRVRNKYYVHTIEDALKKNRVPLVKRGTTKISHGPKNFVVLPSISSCLILLLVKTQTVIKALNSNCFQNSIISRFTVSTFTAGCR